jgi:hypothetical protein
MHFTHAKQLDDAASVANSLQIFSLKLQEIKEANWPLRVYGTVASRDTVDRNRNILFHRARENCQILTQKVRPRGGFLFTSFCLHLSWFVS